MEYVPANNIENTAAKASRKDCSESIPIFARDIIDPRIVIREIGTGSACMTVTVQIKALFFILYSPLRFCKKQLTLRVKKYIWMIML